MPGQRLVDRVVDDLVDEVVQPGAPVEPMYIAGPLADGLEAFEDLDLVGAVVVRTGAVAVRPATMAASDIGSRDGRSVASVSSWSAVVSSDRASDVARLSVGRSCESEPVTPDARQTRIGMIT